MSEPQSTDLTHKEAHRLLKYKDGILFWRRNIPNRDASKRDGGKPAGHVNVDGYVTVGVHGRSYYAHRIIFLMHYGYLPENDMDHIDQNKSNNRIENLREVSRQCNMRNCGNHKHNTSGVKGVYWVKRDKKWATQIAVSRKNYTLGHYGSFSNAVLARLAAEQCLGWEGCDSSSPAYKHAVKHGLIRENNG